MEKKIEELLEFDKIKTELAEFAISSLGKKAIGELSPSSNFKEVKVAQAETKEGADIIRLRDTIPLTVAFDVNPYLKRLKVGAHLNGLEIYQIGSNLRISRLMKNFIADLQNDGVELPHLYQLADKFISLRELENQIALIVDESGHLLDSASDELRRIRTSLAKSERRVREKLEALIKAREASKMLSSTTVTIRNDRYVLPVKQEYKGHYGGIVHGESASGQTLFVEPQSVVDLNNERSALQSKEAQEMERILREISALLAEYIQEIDRNTYVLGRFDFILAKARFGKEMKAISPLLNNDGLVRLFAARHPLLDPEKAVLNDIMIGEDYKTVVITGPNTGGKTITLKTLGLLTLMAQSGLQIPAQEDSDVAVFENIFADIGDEQSIEQSLSTFSSHMKNIVHILVHMNANSLILFDELGAGTDPQEGAALAIAILDEAAEKKATVLATTHYPELKAYGYERPFAMNASVEFNVETLSPTYKLSIGIPGRSNALEISERLGLKKKVVENARSLIDSESKDLNEMISSLEKKRNLAEEKYQKASEITKEAEKLHQDLQNEIAQYMKQREKLIEKANKKATEIIEKAQQKSEEVIRELRNLQLSGAQGIKEHQLIEAKTKLNKAKPEETQKNRAPRLLKKERKLQTGDSVRILSLGQKGILLHQINESEWNVQIGAIKMRIQTSDLEYREPEKPERTRHITTVQKQSPVKTELDLRGVRYEDALQELDKYIDAALLAGYGQVVVIHGKGTGALRSGVTEFLKNHRFVKSMRFGNAAEGGNGVTVIELK